MKKTLQSLVLIALTGIFGQASAQRYITNQFTGVTVTTDIVYGQNYEVLSGAPVLKDLKLDIYEPAGDTETERPVIVFLHTGSFLPKGLNQLPTGSRSDSSIVQMCTEFAKKGYVVANVDYRLGWNPQGDQDTRTGTILNAVYRAMQDAKNAVRYLRADAALNANPHKIDTNRVILCGQGTGGYIALAYATIDKVAEIQLDKFINQTTNQPYVNQALSGDFEGFGGNPAVNKENYKGYSSGISMVCNYGGAMGDSSWLEPGDVPIVAMQGKADPFAPYTTGGVFVPGTQPPLFVVEVSGARDIVRRANRLGVNDVFKTPAFTDPYTIRANQVNEGYEGLFGFEGQANGSGPWEWWDTSDPFHSNGMMANPLMSKARALLYIDTLQGFFSRRINRVLYETLGVENTLANSNSVSVYPNPAQETVNIKVEELNGGAYHVELLDLMGRVIMREENIRESVYTFNRKDLNNGIYFIKVYSGKQSNTKKLILN